jgi:hypothetical protein
MSIPTESDGTPRVRRATGPTTPPVIDARTHIGDSVVNPAGDDLGRIETIMLDVESGHIAYAVLSFGGFLGLGSKLFAVPWTALRLDEARRRFTLEVSREQLETAEGFDEEHWPQMADPDWALRLHSHFNVPPYWHEQQTKLRESRRLAALQGPESRTGIHY